ncbi:ATP:cob(I)alamin adenosyltransferase [Candidatus Wolfebacteria bacterium]|nr:ATP:cob(I)alamin adenosyltransferase [Candidatus Wolfebacteria bacterium]
MLYTRKGDKGDTYAFGCNQRFMKSSALAEALGAVDEINSLLGFVKVKAEDLRFSAEGGSASGGKILDLRMVQIVGQIQQDLFIVQANLAGAEKYITQEKIDAAEKIIDEIEKQMPAIKTFFISGGTELAALFDYARAIARRAERRVVGLSEERKTIIESNKESQSGAEPAKEIDPLILKYLNRLSSLLYALARYVNFKAGVAEKPPTYI